MEKLFIAAFFSAASTFGWATITHAGETILLLEDQIDLPPPYKQWWYATPSDHRPDSQTHEVFIRGDGKRGDFFGILRVDCVNAGNSEWLATAGFLNSDRVPAQAITKLRIEVCNQDN